MPVPVRHNWCRGRNVLGLSCRAQESPGLVCRSRDVEISRMIMRVVYLVHRPTNKQLFLMLTVVTVVIMTCLDRLKEISKRADKEKRLQHRLTIWKFTFLGHWPPSQFLKLSLIIAKSPQKIGWCSATEKKAAFLFDFPQLKLPLWSFTLFNRPPHYYLRDQILLGQTHTFIILNCTRLTTAVNAGCLKFSK